MMEEQPQRNSIHEDKAGRDKRREEEDAAITDVDEFIASFPALLQQARQLHQDDKLFLAYRLVKKLRRSLQHHQAAAHSAEAVTQLRAIEAEMEKCQAEHQLIAKEKKEVRLLMRELLNNDGWTLMGEHEGGNVKVFYRNEKSTPVHSIKMQGIVESSALNLMAVMNEHELYNTWIPLLKEVRLVKQISRYRKVVYMSSSSLPWPISTRDIVLYGYGVDNLEDDRAVVMVRSVTENDIEPELIPPVNSHVRADVQSTGLIIEPLGENRTRLVMMTNADPKLSYLPYTLLNWATKVLSYQLWSAMVRHSQGIEGSQYEALIAQNEAFYADIKAKLRSVAFASGEEESTNQESSDEEIDHRHRSASSSSSSDKEPNDDNSATSETRKTKKREKLRRKLSPRKHKHHV